MDVRMMDPRDVKTPQLLYDDATASFFSNGYLFNSNPNVQQYFSDGNAAAGGEFQWWHGDGADNHTVYADLDEATPVMTISSTAGAQSTLPPPPPLTPPPPPPPPPSSPRHWASMSTRRPENAIHIQVNTTSDPNLSDLLNTPLSKLPILSANIYYDSPTPNSNFILEAVLDTKQSDQWPAECTVKAKSQSNGLSRRSKYQKISKASTQFNCASSDPDPTPQETPRRPSAQTLHEPHIQPRGERPVPAEEETGRMDSPQYLEPLEDVTINLGDENSLRDFYEERFRCLQQIPCKAIAKDWIRFIEPRKQTQHPYNGGDRAKGLTKNSGVDVGELCKPEWWPPQGCRHREPDHISRAERLVLLMHLLRNLWDPNAKTGYKSIDVDRLAQSTHETVASWSGQEIYRDNRVILEGIYNMRRAEQRLKNGETDASEQISCPQVPRIYRGQKKWKQLAGTKRRANSDLPDTENNDAAPPPPDETLSAPQVSTYPQYDVGGPGGSQPEAVTSAPTQRNDWAQDSTMNSATDSRAGDTRELHHLPWSHGTNVLADPSFATRIAHQHAAEQSSSASDYSDDRRRSPHGSTHPSSVTSEFTPNQQPVSLPAGSTKSPADVSRTTYDWPNLPAPGPSTGIAAAYRSPYELVNTNKEAPTAPARDYPRQPWVLPAPNNAQPPPQLPMRMGRSGYAVQTAPASTDSRHMYGPMSVATPTTQGPWHLG